MKNKRKISFLTRIVFLGMFVFTSGCNDETYVYDRDMGGGKPFNPDLPVEITGFSPASGKIREKVVITGSNFGNNINDVQVFFDDGYSDKKATVINVNGSSIYCLAPRQTDGNSRIKVVVSEGVQAIANETFRYHAVANVSWVAGVGLRNGTGAKYNDGTLAEANFWKPQGIVALGDDQMMTFGFHEGAANKVRFISVKDDQVITLQNGVYLGKPAINEERTRVYATSLNPPHIVYEYKKENGWMPYNVGEITAVGAGNDRIRSLVMMDKGHDPDQKWLYFCHKDRFFGRFNIETQQTEILGQDLDYNAAAFVGYMVYDKLRDCFYFSHYSAYSIYKISKTGANWTDGVKAELFAGSPSQSAVVDGSLADSRFRDPRGMCMDDEDNLYICDADRADVIRKISISDGYVSTVAGVLDVEKPLVNGDPAQSVFLDPYDISYDGNGNFFIIEWWESTIRKYSIE